MAITRGASLVRCSGRIDETVLTPAMVSWGGVGGQRRQRTNTVQAGYWITQKGSSAHPRQHWTSRDLLRGRPIQHFSLAVGPSAQRSVQPGDRILIYWPGPGNRLFMGT